MYLEDLIRDYEFLRLWSIPSNCFPEKLDQSCQLADSKGTNLPTAEFWKVLWLPPVSPISNSSVLHRQLSKTQDYVCSMILSYLWGCVRVLQTLDVSSFLVFHSLLLLTLKSMPANLLQERLLQIYRVPFYVN